MRTSVDRILTTHVGSLQTPDYMDPDKFGQITAAELRTAVGAVVKDQKDAGVDIIDEGELTKGGIWVTYVHDRFTGFESVPSGEGPAPDCGLGFRTHPQVALAKLKSMADGASIASKQLWGHA